MHLGIFGDFQLSLICIYVFLGTFLEGGNVVFDNFQITINELNFSWVSLVLSRNNARSLQLTISNITYMIA